MNFYDFYQGQEFEAYTWLGAHVTDSGVVFRTYAPAAFRVSVIGEFNGWTETPMRQVEDGRFWECQVENASSGQMYKYRIYRREGGYLDHSDPYAFYSEKRPGTASVIYDMGQYQFQDKAWMERQNDHRNLPLNIYELHLGSWRRKDESLTEDVYAEGRESAEDVSGGWYSYAEIGAQLIPYLKENGYNYVEFMPLNEYPADESWGYQATGFYSATSRYGTPDELRSLIDACHQNGIGVLLDVVTVHFCSNDYSLGKYDGTSVYEYPHPDVGNSEWGSSNFMHSSGPVRTFLQSASAFWLKEYHFDGLRFDAVGNLLYWQGNIARGENRDAVMFLRNMNSGLKKRFPGCMLIAEDSTAFAGVTKPVWENGLGFDYKWDMGWMNDTLSFLQSWPSERREKYHKLTFSMQYFYNENYLLPLSHDEVVHGKATILQKMYGDYDLKFPQVKALYLYMYLHPGKKLNFMGNEIGQLREWDEKRGQDWFLTKYPLHDELHRFLMVLNEFYRQHSSLWQRDYDRGGFEWLDANQEEKVVYVFRRRSSQESLLCLFNFSDQMQEYICRPGWSGVWTKVFDTAMSPEQNTVAMSENTEAKNQTEMRDIPGHTIRIQADGSAVITLPPFSGRCYQERGAKQG